MRSHKDGNIAFKQNPLQFDITAKDSTLFSFSQFTKLQTLLQLCCSDDTVWTWSCNSRQPFDPWVIRLPCTLYSPSWILHLVTDFVNLLLSCISPNSWGWPLRAETCRSDTVLIKWCSNNICVHLSVFTRNVVVSTWIWTRQNLLLGY